MKINAISAGNHRAVSFNGTWTKREIYNAADYHVYDKKEYTPDKDETPEKISIAWLKETGALPIDWIKKVNPFNQVEESRNGAPVKTEYSIKGHKFMPLDIIKASVEMKIDRAKASGRTYMEELIDLANIALMESDKDRAKAYEKEMVDQYKRESSPRSKDGTAYLMNEYKENWGKAIRTLDKYVPGADLYQDSDEMVKKYQK